MELQQLLKIGLGRVQNQTSSVHPEDPVQYGRTPPLTMSISVPISTNTISVLELVC